MSTAMPALPIQDVARCIEGVIRGTITLRDSFGVTIIFDDLEPQTGGEWNHETRTLKIRRNISIDDSALLVSEVWRLLNIGIHATIARPTGRPRLTLITNPTLATT